MARELTNINFTNHQKIVMSKILVAATPQIAAGELKYDDKIIHARGTLIRAGLIKYNENAAILTPKGRTAAQQSGLIDEQGNLTPEGEKWAYHDVKIQESFSLIKSFRKYTI